jgi:hypothetical protein
MLPFGVTILAIVPQRSEIQEGLTNYLVYRYMDLYVFHHITAHLCVLTKYTLYRIYLLQIWHVRPNAFFRDHVDTCGNAYIYRIIKQMIMRAIHNWYALWTHDSTHAVRSGVSDAIYKLWLSVSKWNWLTSILMFLCVIFYIYHFMSFF